jgi:mono/diheme cytochrome c family protein
VFLKLRRIAPWGVGALLTAAASAGYLTWMRPPEPRPVQIRVRMTAERLERGRYIYLLAGCDDCHSKRDWTRFAGPVIASHRGEGVEFPPELGLPGRVVSGNITTDRESGLGQWSDGEKIRAIRDGIGRDGRRLRPIMPYRRYQQISDEDIYSLVAYLNTLPALKRPTRPEASLFSAIRLRASWVPGKPVPEPNRDDPAEYGGYLVGIAGCRSCHTAGGGNGFVGVPFAGGRLFHLAGGTVVSANITPEPYTGMGRWSEQDWLDRVYSYREYAEGESPKVGPERLTVMPWLGLSRLRPDDLKAMYQFLRRQKPVYRPIDLHPVN